MRGKCGRQPARFDVGRISVDGGLADGNLSDSVSGGEGLNGGLANFEVSMSVIPLSANKLELRH